MSSISDKIAQAKIFAEEIADTSELFNKEALEVAEFETAELAETNENLTALFESITNPLVGNYASKEKSIKDQVIQRPVKTEKTAEKLRVIPDRDAKDAASKFEQRNPELKSSSLVNLLKKAKDCKDKEELLKLLEEYYPDPLLADEALDFLSECSLGDFQKIVQDTKEELNKKYENDIRAEKNISQEVSRFAGPEVEARPKLRQRYLELIHTSEEKGASDLFLDYSKQFPSYKELRRIFAYFYRSLGTDLKSQGPSIDRGLLHSLMQEVRKAQSGIGVYNFFRDRMSLMQKEFDRAGIQLPQELTFEKMAVAFLKIISERYPSLEKVFDNIPLSTLLDILGKIITCNQFRDAIPQTSTAFLFHSLQHRDEVKKAILDALERLEEELEDAEEKEWGDEDLFDQDEEQQKKKKKQEFLETEEKKKKAKEVDQ